YSYYFENSIDAFILTSNTEGNPVSVIEAMSFGIPIISTNICNMPNLVSDNGLLISENPDPYELSDAITRLSRMSKDDVSKMRIASRNRWEKEYKAENNCREFAMELNGL
ncbi:MAG: glycosyltransferase, partial [Lachnospiraceae bacterium]|nr:glycosyltransferase [Lachnospiraceae bacterium]